jgi:signal transduction histidine kinase
MHEINNPLDALLSLLYLLESETTLSERGREHLTLATEEVRRISSIAHAALNDVRDQAHPQDADIPALLSSVLELYNPRLSSRGINVLSRYCRDGNLKGDNGLLRQMFSNLLLNAVDSMPNGGTVNVRCTSCHECNDWQRRGVRVTFADNGCGIAGDDLSRIMEPFFSTKGCDGNGMGLSVVKDVVRKHRGVLRVRSSTKPGHSGSIFSVFLPSS